MRKCKEEGLPQTKPHFCDLHMITILQLCLYKMGGGGDTRGTKKLQQGNETIPYSFQESCCSNVDDCVAGCGILGTGGDGSPYRAKLKLLQSLDRSELAPSTLSLSHFGPGWRIALFCIPVYRQLASERLHGRDGDRLFNALYPAGILLYIQQTAVSIRNTACKDGGRLLNALVYPASIPVTSSRQQLASDTLHAKMETGTLLACKSAEVCCASR